MGITSHKTITDELKHVTARLWSFLSVQVNLEAKFLSLSYFKPFGFSWFSLVFLLNSVLQYVTFSVYDCVISCLNRVAVLSSKYGRNDYATDVKVCVCMFASSVHITCNLPCFKKKKKKKKGLLTWKRVPRANRIFNEVRFFSKYIASPVACLE